LKKVSGGVRDQAIADPSWKRWQSGGLLISQIIHWNIGTLHPKPWNQTNFDLQQLRVVHP
jgi:hypothetical protein